jgi:hypothetical protein
MGEPSKRFFCRTTMVKKPLRSKFCVHTGAVVARMDHYCIWLNTTIGENNHRSFIILILLHLIAAVCGVAVITRYKLTFMNYQILVY